MHLKSFHENRQKWLLNPIYYRNRRIDFSIDLLTQERKNLERLFGLTRGDANKIINAKKNNQLDDEFIIHLKTRVVPICLNYIDTKSFAKINLPLKHEILC